MKGDLPLFFLSSFSSPLYLSRSSSLVDLFILPLNKIRLITQRSRLLNKINVEHLTICVQWTIHMPNIVSSRKRTFPWGPGRPERVLARVDHHFISLHAVFRVSSVEAFDVTHGESGLHDLLDVCRSRLFRFNLKAMLANFYLFPTSRLLLFTIPKIKAFKTCRSTAPYRKIHLELTIRRSADR